MTLLSVPILNTSKNSDSNSSFIKPIMNLISPSTILSLFLILLLSYYFPDSPQSILISKIFFSTLIYFLFIYLLISITTKLPPTLKTIFVIPSILCLPIEAYKAIASSLLFIAYILLSSYLPSILTPTLSAITLVLLVMLHMNIKKTN
jgi:hypothetical protein